ncbi:SAM-dependent DNA methyltransferase [Buttiauxella warmboldiae]|jgi:hypothetical protein|uniref:site-specific DNA-methyltransferase (adenine-specific) n=1 Tax=Buttiauxella warmboldiae TaxID=82993 RepID=A0A3N5DKT7_9ENTR|nr:DNA methyltransferase [Buttiauxella warmboldiae]RPH29265.1 SAM-dependent DNA methyltransferase [Buttiauxella warmboldiae]
MRQPLDKILRKKLEDTVVKARDIVEIAVNEALQRLGVADSQAPGYLNDEQRALRNTLRAHARQLGDKLTDGKQEIERLANEMAYEHWHRMLFARYLEQNNLLMYDEYTPVTLDECFELAEEEPDCKDGWELAGRLAQKMLPQIFRADSPVFAVKLSINYINELENLISALEPAIYQAQDSLGWCYQFWQNKKKKQVNESGVKIGAQELGPVTQLFTEPYMVSFLLDNALGAWWAAKHLTQDDYIRSNNEQELRDIVSIPSVPLEYLRFIKNDESDGKRNKWTLAVGGYERWPEHLSQLKMLDPCCGSGHFLVAVFLMLVPMRMQLEDLTARDAVDAVLLDNIHGLELDQRCVELAAFALALEAWRYPNAGGYRILPELQLACSGMSITEAQKDWKELAKGDDAFSDAITWMMRTFKDAATLGSLIDPTIALEDRQTAPWQLLQQAMMNKSDASTESRTVAQGLVKAAGLLASKYQWVITNVPYRTSGDLTFLLKKFIDNTYPYASSSLETAFLSKLLEFAESDCMVNIVVPLDWLTKPSYLEFRRHILSKSEFNFSAILGAKSFSTPMWDFNIQLLTLINSKNRVHSLRAIDVSNINGLEEKARNLKCLEVLEGDFSNVKTREDLRISFEKDEGLPPLSLYVNFANGMQTGDLVRFSSEFWELEATNKLNYFQGTVSHSNIYSGLNSILKWKGEDWLNIVSPSAVIRGRQAWGKKGIAVSAMGKLYVSMYSGTYYDDNTVVIYPTDIHLLTAIWCYLSSDEYHDNVRNITKALKVRRQLIEVSFDKEKWVNVANKSYPNGLPQPYSNDPSQWIFHGHPCVNVIWDEKNKTISIGKLRQDDSVLQVAVARLLGYQWPAELDVDMELAPEMRQVMKENDNFNELVDGDGIVCIPAVRGEKAAAKRLAEILYKSYGDTWSSSVEDNLLKSVKAKDWDSWLRDKFFEQHCKLFQHRPFIWHIWDGLKDGFSALVNYHKLDYKGLERLIYTYLDDWISIQKRNIADGVDGADIRLTAAENLKVQLEAILEGEKGLDIFVRWKPLEEQPIGWNPDLNDGVRLNIRPFMLAKDVGKKGAGVLRVQPNILWKKDRGTDVESAPWYHLGLQYGGNLGDRINDHHLTLAEKREARENKGL